MALYTLKTRHDYFGMEWQGLKDFTIRFNDRGFQVGDTIINREVVGVEPTGRELTGTITSIIDYAQKPHYVVMGINWQKLKG